MMTALLLGLFSFATLANDKTTITTSMNQNILGVYNCTVEFPIGTNTTFYTDAEFVSISLLGVSASGFGIAGGVNYFFDEANDGFYLGGGLYYLYLTVSNGSYSVLSSSGSFIGMDARVGYKKIFKNGFTLNGGFSTFEASL